MPDCRIVIYDEGMAQVAVGGHDAAGLDLGPHVITRPRGCCRPRRSIGKLTLVNLGIRHGGTLPNGQIREIYGRAVA